MREKSELRSDRPANEFFEEAKAGEKGIVEKTVRIGGGHEEEGLDERGKK